MNRLWQRLTIVLMLVAGTWLLPNIAQAVIPSTERDALIALYAATNGDSWTNNTGWNGVAGTECTWFGITCDVGETMVTGLDLRTNNLVGTIPTEIGDLSNLLVLNLRTNQLSGSIPSSIGNLTSLETLILRENQLTGTIPVEIGNLTALVTLNLHTNQLDGSIPTVLGTLTNLNVLNLRSNLLTGTIPIELSNLTGLTELNLRTNDLSGEIPAELGNLTLLTILNLRSNQLTGTIPSELGNLTNLLELYLRSNILVGEIPASFINLTPTVGLNLRYNGIHTDDATLATHINTYHVLEGGVQDFSLTQTIDADGVVATSVGDTSVELAWNEVSFTDKAGGYRVYRSTSASSGFSMVADVPDKATTSSTLTNLTACTTYFVRVHSYTLPHPDADDSAGNDNEVESDGLTGNLVEFTTTGCPVANPPPPDTGGGGGGCTFKPHSPFDPLLPLLAVISVLYIWQAKKTY